MTNLCHIIRQINRFEMKYIVPLETADQVKQVLKQYLIPDEHGNGQGNYQVANLYYDTRDFRFYWEKLDGIKFRRKLRIRRYQPSEPISPDSLVFVEIKQRYNRSTQKRRAALTYQNALTLCDLHQLPPHDLRDQMVLEEIHRMITEYNLHPVSLFSYTRQAWIGTNYDVGLRVTFDTDLKHYPNQRRMDDLANGVYMLSPSLTIMEIKVNERIPFWLTELVAENNLKLVRFSKYCRSIEVAQNLPAHTWGLS